LLLLVLVLVEVVAAPIEALVTTFHAVNSMAVARVGAAATRMRRVDGSGGTVLKEEEEEEEKEGGGMDLPALGLGVCMVF